MKLLLKNAKIWSPLYGYCAGDSVLVVNGIIQKIYHHDGPFSGRSIDVGGRLLIPAFNDAHLHLMDGGFALQEIDLRDADNEEAFCQRLKEKSRELPKGSWITGGYWDHERWPGKNYPTRELIDNVVPNHPVFVVRLDLHIGTANSLALKQAGIDDSIDDPAGGHFGRNPETGRLNGVVQDAAQEKILESIPQPTRLQRKNAALAAISFAHSLGIGSVQGECSSEEMDIYHELEREHNLNLRISGWRLYHHPKFHIEASDFLKLETQKNYADGSLGATTALLSHPYLDRPETSGLAMHTSEELDDIFADINASGDQIAVHAIGDLAVSRCLDAFAKIDSTEPIMHKRHRIEHLQVAQQNDLRRFQKLGIIASVQPYHCIDDMRWIQNRLGKHQRNAYRLQSLLDSGIATALGTDWTVEPLNPLHTIYAAVTREFLEGGPQGGWYPDEKVSLPKAVELYTYGSAYAEKSEHKKGLIKPGYWADFVVLSQNIFQHPPRELLNTVVDFTIINGNIIYDRMNEQKA